MVFCLRKFAKVLSPCTNHVTTWVPAFCTLLIMWPNKAQNSSNPAVMWLLQSNRIDIKVGSKCKRTLKAIPNLNYLEFSRLPNYGFLAKLLSKKVSWFIRCNQILFTAGKQLERYFSCLEIQEKTSACRKPKFKIWYINWVDTLCTMLIKESTETYSSWL